MSIKISFIDTFVVDFLIGYPIVTIRQVQAGIGSKDYKIAQRYVIKLTQAGILSEVTGQARNRVYRAGEILEAIEGPLERNLNSRVNSGNGKILPRYNGALCSRRGFSGDSTG